MQEKISDFVHYALSFPKIIKQRVTHFFRWIIKSIQYSIILSNDSDWDYSSVLMLLHYKLQRMRKEFLSDRAFAACRFESAAQIRHAEKLIEYVRDGHPEANKLSDEYHEKWGNLKLFDDEGKFVAMPEKSKTENLKESKDELIEMTNKVREIEEKNWNLLFDHLKKYLRDWWD